MSINIELLFEDKKVLAFDKPTGLLVHKRSDKDTEYTFTDYLNHNFPHLRVVTRNGLVHRLDRETSGVILVAKNDDSYKYFKDLFKHKKIAKVYYAIVEGRPKDKFLIDLPLKRTPSSVKRQVSPAGKASQTNIELVDTNEKFSLVIAKPITGRTNQIRVHLKYVGHPIVNDDIYGTATKTGNLMLHAYSISYGDTITKQIVAPIPKRIIEFAKQNNLKLNTDAS